MASSLSDTREVERDIGNLKIDESNASSWTTEQVCEWLQTLKLSENLTALFIDHSVNGSLLLDLNYNNLVELGVTPDLNCKKIWNALKPLKKASSQYICAEADIKRASNDLIRIPQERNWRSVNELCPFLNSGECPRDKLVDVENAVTAAVDIVDQWKDHSERVPPIIISRVYRGGKTTLIDLISKKLSENRNYYVITISTNGNFNPREDETLLQALIRLIAYQMVEHNVITDRDNLFQCREADLLIHLNEITKSGKTVVLLIDELNNMGVPLDSTTSSFLTTHFLDMPRRYLIFSSHVQFHVDDTLAAASNVLTSRSGRTMETLPLPFCTDRNALENMLEGSSVTDLKITLAVGIPSLLYVMSKPSRKEMSFEERFDKVISRHLKTKGRNSRAERDYVNQNREALLDDFLYAIITGTKGGGFFEGFSTPVDQLQKIRFPLPYIPIILQFLQENDGKALYDSLKASAESVETGRDWEMVVNFSIYIRSLAAKYCKRAVGDEPWLGPFRIATNGVEDVKVITIHQEVTAVIDAVNFIKRTTQKAKTIYIFQLAYAKFPDFDGFVSYGKLEDHMGQETSCVPIIHGFQCNVRRGYPRNPVDRQIEKGWFLRGGETVNTPGKNGWEFPSMLDIETDLLGFGLRVLHPMTWGDFPESDGFDN